MRCEISKVERDIEMGREGKVKPPSLGGIGGDVGNMY